MLKRIVLASVALSLLSPAAFAQCSGQAPANTYCGNPTGSTALPGWKPYSGIPVDIDVGSTTITGGTSKGILYNNAGVLGNLSAPASSVLVSDGSSNPSMSTTLPNGLAMGTPLSLTLTNATGLPISTGVSGLGTGIATALAINVGSAGAPVLFNGAGGTPSSIVLTNATGLPIGGLTGLGTGVATALAVNIGTSGAVVVQDGALGTPSSGTLTNATGLPISTGVSGLGTGIAAALANNTGSAGAPVLFNGALGTPSSGTVTNLTGTASININGTVGATTPTTGAFTSVAYSTTLTGTSSNASALAIGPNGATNPTLRVDASTASAATGITITGAAAAGGVSVTARSSGTDENLKIDAKGAGTITLGGTSTGNITTPRVSTFTNSTASTSTTTGAVLVSGGLGVAGAVNAGDQFHTIQSLNGAATGFYAENTNTGASATINSSFGVTDAGAFTLQAASIAGGSYAVTRWSGSGGMYFDNKNASGSMFFRTGNTPTNAIIIDANQVTNVSAAVATPAGGSTTARLIFGTTSGFGIYYGSGAPTVSAAQGSIYLRSDGSSTTTRLYVNTNGTTGWTNFTSGT